MSKRILYVEDNPHNMMLMRRLLTAEGHTIIEAVDGESGWRQALLERPDLILTDLLMPDIDGFELTRRVKNTPELSHIPVVAITAYGSPEVEAKARAAGCDDFLHKPAAIPDIQATIHRFVGYPIDAMFAAI